MRKSMKTAAAILAAVLAAGMLTGCGGKAETPAATQAAEGQDTAGGEKKTLRVAMECAYAPYNWTQPDDSNGAVPIVDSNEYAYGYDVMMAKKISEELGYDLQIVRPWKLLVFQ